MSRSWSGRGSGTGWLDVSGVGTGIVVSATQRHMGLVGCDVEAQDVYSIFQTVCEGKKNWTDWACERCGMAYS